jgi:hypothetical protein
VIGRGVWGIGEVPAILLY